MSTNNQTELPSYGDLATVQLTISQSDFPVLICEGVSDRDNAYRLLGSTDGLLVIVSDQIQGEGTARRKVEKTLAGVSVSAAVAGTADSDVCIDSLLNYQDHRVQQANIFYSDGYTLENYILIYWNDMQGYLDPANIDWSSTLDNTSQYFKAFSVWSVFVREVCMREHRTHGYSKKKVCKQIMKSPLEDLLKVVHEDVVLDDVTNYMVNVSIEEYARCLNIARQHVETVGKIEHSYLIDKWFVPYIVSKILDNSEIKKHENRRYEELCDSCLSHLMTRDSNVVTLHLSKALTWLGVR